MNPNSNSGFSSFPWLLKRQYASLLWCWVRHWAPLPGSLGVAMDNTNAECTVLQHCRRQTDCVFYLHVFTVGLSKHNSIISQNICIRGLFYFITTFIKGGNQWSKQKYQWRRDGAEMITKQTNKGREQKLPSGVQCSWSQVLSRITKRSLNKTR